MSKGGKMWGGRFSGALDAKFAAFQDSLTQDSLLGPLDLMVNREWVRALAYCGVFTNSEATKVNKALDALGDQWARNGVPMEGAEDIHSLVEQELGRKVGELAKRIHTGRSRNDQVATDLRLFLVSMSHGLLAEMLELLRALVDVAERHAADPMPGYTHLQRAQPITIGHHALAHAEALGRDRERIEDALDRMGECPLGSGALAGTTLRVDREDIAHRLGFHSATRNSIDATASRDHACELLFCCAMTMTDLSRLAEDYIFYASHEAGLLTFTDQVSTGSSLMPQKRNPDAMELLRGHAGRAIGALTSALVSSKGLPLGYNRDLQPQRAELTEAIVQTMSCITIAATAVRNVRFDVARCRAAAARGYLNATDLADLLVAAGVPFRDAHEQVGRAVNRALELGVELDDLPDTERKRLLPQLGGDLRAQLSVDAVLARRNVLGGTSPQQVQRQVEFWRERIEEWSDPPIGDDLDDEDEDEDEDEDDEVDEGERR